MAAVTKAIHEYGLGHESTLSPLASSEQEQTGEGYEAAVNILLIQDNFAQLEKIARQNREERRRLVGDVWKTYAFFNAMENPPHGATQKESDFELEIEAVKKWVSTYPDSATARIALAHAYLGFAAFARGTAYADSVSEAQWQHYYAKASLAKLALLEASTLKDRDRGWYDAMLQVAHDESWDRAQYRELLDQAAAFEPSYYHYYRIYANDLLPQWGGQPGEIQAFAEEIAAHRPEPDSSILYFEILGALDCYCQQSIDALASTSWPKMKQGYGNIKQLYGTSNLKANRYLLFAFAAKDKSAAQEALADVSTPEPNIWNANTFEGIRNWANSPLP